MNNHLNPVMKCIRILSKVKLDDLLWEQELFKGLKISFGASRIQHYFLTRSRRLINRFY
jgi:hypothetical protein